MTGARKSARIGAHQINDDATRYSDSPSLVFVCSARGNPFSRCRGRIGVLGFLSIDALNWAFEARSGSSSSKLVLVTMADAAKTDQAFLSIAEMCRRTELNRKTVVSAIAHLESLGLIADTGDRKGATKLIPVYQLNILNSPKNGTVKQSLICAETVPILPPNSPVFTPNSPKNGTRIPKEPNRTQKEPISVWKLEKVKEAKEEQLKALRNQHYTDNGLHSHWDTNDNRDKAIKLKTEIQALTKRISEMDFETYE